MNEPNLLSYSFEGIRGLLLLVPWFFYYPAARCAWVYSRYYYWKFFFAGSLVGIVCLAWFYLILGIQNVQSCPESPLNNVPNFIVYEVGNTLILSGLALLPGGLIGLSLGFIWSFMRKHSR